jgi:hypothetical protein
MVFADKWSVDNGIVHADNSDGSPVASFYLDDGSVEIVSNDYIDNRDRTITRVTVTGILETY